MQKRGGSAPVFNPFIGRSARADYRRSLHQNTLLEHYAMRKQNGEPAPVGAVGGASIPRSATRGNDDGQEER